MIFPFTFKLSVPGLTNPFYTATPETQEREARETLDRAARDVALERERRRRPSPCVPSSTSPIPPPPKSRKRGWEPSYSEPSLSTAAISSNGYLDTPAKYRELAGEGCDEVQRMAIEASDLPPPAKRRRGLAGSIVSTALSAALIGTAVGLTVYRMWRDRGKETEPAALPPPPYQEGSWTPVEEPEAITVAPASPRGKNARHPAGNSSVGKRSVGQQRKSRPRVLHQRQYSHPHSHSHTPPVTASSSSAFFTPVKPEFDFSSAQADEESNNVEEQMDWIGGKLAMLIEEGKKALGREVVVMSESKEDEVDDGSGAWEEEDEGAGERGSSASRVHRHLRQTTHSPSLSRSASPRRSKRPKHLGAINVPALPTYPSSSQTTSFSLSPRSPQFYLSVPGTPRSSPISISSSRSVPISYSFTEDARSWESPELRESMEKARAKVLKSRGQ